MVIELENNNEVKKWSVGELQETINKYKQKCKEMKGEQKNLQMRY